MTKNEQLMVAGALAVGGVLLFAGEAKGAGFMDVLSRGKKLSGSSWYTNGQPITQAEARRRYGVIAQSPGSLVAQATLAAKELVIDADTYAAARMLRSEGAKQGDVRLHVAYNDLAELQARFPDTFSSLFKLLTYSSDRQRRGLFGEQYTPASDAFPTQSVRRYATTEDPYLIDVLTVLQVKRDRANGIDKAHKATKFIDIDSMGGVQQGTVAFEKKNAEWTRGGYEAFTLPEYGDNLVLYRRA